MKVFSEKDIEPKFKATWEKIIRDNNIFVDAEAGFKTLRKQRRLTYSCPVSWPKMADKFGGFRTGELTMITGDTGHGKTTYGTNILYHLAQTGRQCAVFSLEMGRNALLKKLFQMHLNTHFNPDLDNLTLDHFEIWCGGRPLYFYANDGKIDYRSQLRLAIAYAAMKLDVIFVLIDHFHMITKPTWDAAHIEHAAADLRYLASALNIAIAVIVHPAKIQGDRQERVIQMDDLKGSSGLKQYADNVISVFFNKSDKVTNVHLHKIRDDRYGKAMGDVLSYRLNQENLLFEELVE